MTIKEMEALSGMARANIRYYEQEGLLSPKRTSNGYRDYSQEDLETLMRIKLLRSLNISLEEIRELQSGKADLPDTLSVKLRELEQVMKDADRARQICRAMREDRVTYATLDAARYLNGIGDQDAGKPEPYVKAEEDSVPKACCPWRRFLARSLDYSLCSLILTAVLALVFHVNIARMQENLFAVCLEMWFSMTLMLLLEPLFLHWFGTTPGKCIFGLRLEDEDGRRLTYNMGLNRTWNVIVQGLGLYIPVYRLVKLWKSYKRCGENVDMPWDEGVVYSVKDFGSFRGWLYALAYALLIGASVMVTAFAEVPPNRGDMTVAQFAENYNFLAEYYGIDSGQYLDRDGLWAANKTDGTFIINLGDVETPDFEYTLKDGYINEIRMTVEVTDGEDWIGSFCNELTLAALSFAGAQRDAGLLFGGRKAIADEIAEDPFGDLEYSRAGIKVRRHVAYEGYIMTSYVMIRDESESGRFLLEFSMTK